MEKSELMDFLRRSLPESDWDCYPEGLFEQFAEHGVMLRRTVPWCREMEEEIFLHYVLCPRVNDEDLSFHRRVFFDALWPRVRGLESPEDRVLEVNRWCAECAAYEAQDERTASPMTVFRCGSGRCGEESAFLVSALRSVGIAARQVYVPRWSHCDDNHAWAEALCGGRWRFLGACEPEPVLDRGWFNASASRAVLVRSLIFGVGTSPLHGALLGREGAVSWYDQTGRYAGTRTVTFRALREGGPAPGTSFQIQILNEAGFHTVAALTADENGEARAELGRGTLHVLAVLGKLRAEGELEGDEITLRLAPAPAGDTGWRFWDARAAEPVPSAPLDGEQRARRGRVLAETAAIRERKAAELYKPVENSAWEDLLRGARGNYQTISDFLARDADPRREALVRSLSDKDLRDVTAEVLEDHLTNAPPAVDVPWEIYNAFVLCPRVGLEPLTPWRGALRRALPPGLKPESLRRYLEETVDTEVDWTYGNLLWTPLEALRAGRCDRRSLDILYVVCLRALGVPARLRTLDGTPEVWRGGRFEPVRSEKTGKLRLLGDKSLRYKQNWTLSRQTAEGWQILALPEDAREAEVPAGRYRLITSNRLPNGSQFAASRELQIEPGEVREIPLFLRGYDLRDMLSCQELPVLPGRTPEGEAVADLCRSGGPGVLCWAEPGTEPTEHLVNELLALGALSGELVLLPGSLKALARPGFAALAARPGVRVMLDDWAYDRELLARQMGCDPGLTPLTVVRDGRGHGVYAAAGYRVGAGALLENICRFVCEKGENLDE